MKTLCLVLHLFAAAMAAAAPAYADGLHGGVRESIDAQVLSSGPIQSVDGPRTGALRPSGGITFNRPRIDPRAGAQSGAPMLGIAWRERGLAAASQAAVIDELAQVRAGVGHVRLMPPVLLGSSPRL
jgi:hypothetical protein